MNGLCIIMLVGQCSVRVCVRHVCASIWRVYVVKNHTPPVASPITSRTQSRGGSRNSLRGGGGVLGQNSSRGGGLGSRSVGIFIY